MLIIDSLIISGVRFVLDKVAAAVETEMNDDSVLRERLLEAQMRLEVGEISQQEFDDLEADIVVRIREIKARQRGGESAAISPKEMKVTGIEASFEGDEHSPRGGYAPPAPLNARSRRPLSLSRTPCGAKAGHWRGARADARRPRVLVHWRQGRRREDHVRRHVRDRSRRRALDAPRHHRSRILTR